MSMFRLILLAVLVALASTYVDVLSVIRPTYPVHRGGVVLITGASTGIGYDAALELMKEGYYVLAGVRKESDIANFVHAQAAVKGEHSGLIKGGTETHIPIVFLLILLLFDLLFSSLFLKFDSL